MQETCQEVPGCPGGKNNRTSETCGYCKRKRVGLKMIHNETASGAMTRRMSLSTPQRSKVGARFKR